MLNLGLKYQNHNEHHFSEDTLYSIKKEVVKNGRCLRHQDITINMLGGLITRECKRCAAEYRLNEEIKEIENKLQICVPLINTSDITTNKKEIETQTIFKIDKVDMGTQTDNLTSEMETQTFTETGNDDVKIVQNVELEDNDPNDVKYGSPVITKIIAEIVINYVVYSLCEVNIWEGTARSPIVTKKYFKVKQYDETQLRSQIERNKAIRVRMAFGGGALRSHGEYLIGDITKIRNMLNLSYTFYNGAKILTEHPPLMYPGYKMADGKFVMNHIANKKNTDFEWCDLSYRNAEEVLTKFSKYL